SIETVGRSCGDDNLRSEHRTFRFLRVQLARVGGRQSVRPHWISSRALYDRSPALEGRSHRNRHRDAPGDTRESARRSSHALGADFDELSPSTSRGSARSVFAAVCGHTRETSRAARSEPLVLERKHREEFDEATRPAPLFAQNSGWHEIGLHETSRSRWYGCARRFSTSGAPVELKCSPATMAARAAHI